MHIRPIALLLLFFVVGSHPVVAQEDFTRLEPTAKEIEASLRTDWYGIYFKGDKIGYYVRKRSRTDKEISESVDLHMKIVSFGKQFDFRVRQGSTFDAKAPYALVKGEYKESTGPVEMVVEATRDAKGGFDVVQTVGKNVRKKAVGPIDFTYADSMTLELWIQRGQQRGAKIKTRDIELKDQKIEALKSKILDIKTSLVNGVDVKFYEVESITSQNQISLMSRHDSNGNMLSGFIASTFEMRAEPEEQAKDTRYSKDLFVLGMAKVDRPLGEHKDVDELVLDLEGPPNIFVDGPRQSVVKEAGKTRLRLGKRFGVPVKATEEDVKENLKETSVYDLTDPKIKALAAKAAGDAKTDEAKVKNIAQFVHNYIKPELTNNLPTIHDLIERKKGDCKSYALLFCTLSRANGIPTRELAGLMYTGDQTKAFGGHAWNEVILNGQWVPIDATFNETDVDATHLSFGADDTAKKSMLESIGTLKLRVVEVKTK